MIKYNRNSTKKIRQAQGLSLRKFARGLGLSHNAVSLWEKGGCVPTTKTLIKIANEFGTDVADFFEEGKEPER